MISSVALIHGAQIEIQNCVEKKSTLIYVEKIVRRLQWTPGRIRTSPLLLISFYASNSSSFSVLNLHAPSFLILEKYEKHQRPIMLENPP